jgi:hypothetical protein
LIYSSPFVSPSRAQEEGSHLAIGATKAPLAVFERIACGILFATLAITSTAQLQGTLFFPAAAFALALLLGVHHVITNINGPEGTPTINLFRQEGCGYHETWIVAATTAGLVSTFGL